MNELSRRGNLLNYGPWFFVPGSPFFQLRLFCFTYAGGSCNFYCFWAKRFLGRIELWAFQPPGRGNRMKEKPIRRLDELVEVIVTSIDGFLDLPFVFFGHSLGSLIAFELTRRLRLRNARLPEHLFVSACSAPHLARKRKSIHLLGDEELIECIRSYGGTPQEVIGDPEMLKLVLPLIRADFEVYETWNYCHETPLSVPITVFGGTEDEIATTDLAAWREQTNVKFSKHMLPGGHFFIHSAEKQLIDILQMEMSVYTADIKIDR